MEISRVKSLLCQGTNSRLDIWHVRYRCGLAGRSPGGRHYIDTITIFKIKNDYRVLKSNLKFFTSDLLYIVNCIKVMLNKQYKKFNIKLTRIKIQIIYNLSRDFITKFINKIFSHVFEKIQKQ